MEAAFMGPAGCEKHFRHVHEVNRVVLSASLLFLSSPQEQSSDSIFRCRGLCDLVIRLKRGRTLGPPRLFLTGFTFMQMQGNFNFSLS